MFQKMSIYRPYRLPTVIPTCIMTSSTLAAIYSYPTDVPMCLVMFSPPIFISALATILEACDDLDQADEATHTVQMFGSRVEIHFEYLNDFSLEYLALTITSFPHAEIGDWAMVPSVMGLQLN